MLAALLVHRGNTVSADALIEAAWGEVQPHHPHTALHTVLSRLRALLGDGVVEHDARGYRLSPPPGMLDSDDFEELLRCAASSEAAEARDLLTRALALWRGSAYEGLADSPVVRAEAARLDGLRMDAVEAHATACIDCGHPDAAILPLERLLAEEPFREHATEVLLRALHHAGRRADALARFDDHRRVLADELGLTPSPAVLEVRDQLLTPGHAPRAERQPELPAWLDTSTSFIGREDELADLVRMVTTDRLTVVTGPGGVGKSRLAAESLPTLHHQLGLPVVVIELAETPDGHVSAVLADGLGLRGRTGAGTDDLVEYLVGAPHLVVLDTCEHLLEEIRPLLTVLVRRCRGARFLATSRHRLGVASERLLPLAPLRVPPPGAGPDDQLASAAVRLLTDRVRRLRPAFVVTAHNVQDVVLMCRQVDGLPLGLELAASRVATVGAAELLDLGPGLDEVVAWSYRLLGEGDRDLLAILSVFPGEFTLASVRGVTAHLVGWSDDPRASLVELSESSLVESRVEGRVVRYRLLDTVRAHAAARLASQGRQEDARLAHAAWVRAVVADVAADWSRLDGAVIAGRLTEHSSEILTAMGWSLAVDRLDLATAIGASVARCLHWVPGPRLRDLIVEVAERAALHPEPDMAGGIAAGAFFAAERGDGDRAKALAHTALRAQGPAEAAHMAWLALGVEAMYSGEFEVASQWFNRLVDSTPFAVEWHTSLALIACYTDDLTLAREHLGIALAGAPSAADSSRAFAWYAAGEVAARTDPAQGAQLLTAAATEARRVGAEQVQRVSDVALFALLVRIDQDEQAFQLGARLLGDLRRGGAWAQTWTTTRIAAELLAGAGRPADAAFLLGAATAAPSAPPPVGLDIDRYATLEGHLSRVLGPAMRERISAMAASTPRAQVVTRAQRTLSELASVRG